MNELIDLTGRRFGKLVVVSRAENNTKSGNAKWTCKCDCGKIIDVIGSKLRNGHTKSCGCNRLNAVAKGHSKERIYRIWRNMIRRCYKTDDEHYKWYGLRGIKVCQQWKEDFLEFREWAFSNGYKENLSIDRIDVDGDYEPSNCRWVSQKEQCNNKTSNKIIDFEDEKYTVSQFADYLGYKYSTVDNRLRLGWTTEMIAKIPER